MKFERVVRNAKRINKTINKVNELHTTLSRVKCKKPHISASSCTPNQYVDMCHGESQWYQPEAAAGQRDDTPTIRNLINS